MFAFSCCFIFLYFISDYCLKNLFLEQYRQMRRKEQDRLARMDVDYQKRKEVTEFNKRREERLKEAEERTAKKRLKRQKKKQKKQEKKIKLEAGDNGEHKQEQKTSEEDQDQDSGDDE